MQRPGGGRQLSWEHWFSPADYVKYNSFSVVVSSQKMSEQLWGWGRTLFALILREHKHVIEGHFKQLEELALHSQVNLDSRAQQGSLDFPWPHCWAAMQPRGCSSFVSKHVLCSVQYPTGTVEWLSPLSGSTWGVPQKWAESRKTNGKGQGAFLSHNIKTTIALGNLQATIFWNTSLLISGKIRDAPSIFLGQKPHKKSAWPNWKYSYADTATGDNSSEQTLPTHPFCPGKYLHAALMLAQELQKKKATCIL